MLFITDDSFLNLVSCGLVVCPFELQTLEAFFAVELLAAA